MKRLAVVAALLACLVLAGCNVFRNTVRDRRMDKVDARVALDIARVDTSKRIVWERVAVRPPLPGQSYSFSGMLEDGQLTVENDLFRLHIGLDSLGKVLNGTFGLPPADGGLEAERLTIEQQGKTLRDQSSERIKTKSTAEERTDTASWKGVWVWLGVTALVLVFLYVLVRYYLKR